MSATKSDTPALAGFDIRLVTALLLAAVIVGLLLGDPGTRSGALLATLALVGVGVVALLLWKAEWSVPLMLVAASFDLGGRIISEPMPLTAYQAVLLIGLASWALRLLGGDESARPRFTLIDAGLLLLLGAALWSLPFSLDKGDTVMAIARLVFIYLFYQLTSTFLRKQWVVDASVAGFVGAGVLQALIALAQVRGASIGNTAVRVGGPTSPLRGSAFFDDPNYLAAMLAAAVVVAAIKVVHARSLRQALPWLVAAGISALGVYVTYSRTGLLALAVGLVVVWALAPSGRKRWVFLAGVLAAAGIVAANPEAVIGRFTALTDVDSDQSAATRYYMITSTLEIIRDHWAMGTGLGAFDMAYPAYRIAGSSFSVIRPHQLPLAMWAEMGIAGLVAEVALTLAVLRMVWTSIRTQGPSVTPHGIVDLLAEAGDRLTLGQKAGLAIIVSYAVGSLFQYFLYIEYLWFGVALLAGSTIARAALSSEVQDV